MQLPLIQGDRKAVAKQLIWKQEVRTCILGRGALSVTFLLSLKIFWMFLETLNLTEREGCT